jgi:xanthine dehydrogenase accessory factor
MNWAGAALSRLATGADAVLVTITGAQGSTPRDAGTKMLVLAGDIEGTIGGGKLEHKAIALARQMLATGSPIFQIKRFSLGPELSQCCGGNVQMMFEVVAASSGDWLERWSGLARAKEPWSLVTGFDGAAITKTLVGPGRPADDGLPAAVRQQIARRAAALIRADLVGAVGEGIYCIEPNGPPASEILLFGAGHVGKAIVRQFEHLPFHLTWIDSRDDEFPAVLPGNVTRRIAAMPPALVDQAPADGIYLVMTHSHPLDLEICARILRRADFRFLGLIGSETKRARFTSRLRAIGIPERDLSRLTSPIGVPGIGNKEPAAIAVAVAAQLLLIDNAAAQRRSAPRSAAQAGE